MTASASPLAPAIEPAPPEAPPAAAWRTDTITESVLILMALTVVQRMVGFVRAVLFCRWLDPADLGRWDMAYSFILIAPPLLILAVPAAFGRYVEHYRRLGHLRTLICRTAIWCAVSSVVGAGLVAVFHGQFAALIFGEPGQGRLMLLVALSLPLVVLMNYQTELLTALRKVRVVSSMQLASSLAFALVGVGMLIAGQQSAESIVLAFTAGTVLAVGIAAVALSATWRAIPRPAERLQSTTLWGKLLPFVVWVTVTSFMGHLFAVADRYMIIHFSGISPEGALGLVGEYHSSRIVPLLLMSVAMLLAGMLTPHLSADWEAGRRHTVIRRLNLFLKLLGFVLTGTGVAVLLAAPWLFDVAFAGKFAGGEEVLPWALTYCIWFGLILAAQMYLLCAEQARLASLALGAGLAVNVVLNLLLLPRLGLLGAVLATAAAHAVALLLVLAFCRWSGLAIDRGTWLIMALPVVLNLGPWIALAVMGAVALAAVRDRALLDEEERALLADSARGLLARLHGGG